MLQGEGLLGGQAPYPGLRVLQVSPIVLSPPAGRRNQGRLPGLFRGLCVSWEGGGGRGE